MNARPYQYRQAALLALPVAALLAASVLGALAAERLEMGLATLLALWYGPLALISVPLGIALWVPLLFLESIPAFNLGAKAAAILIVFGWLGGLRSGRAAISGVVRRHARLFAALGFFLIWLTLSIIWASDPGRTANDLWRWCAVALLFLIIATTLSTANHIRLVLSCFIGGALISVVIGLLGLGPAVTPTTGVSPTDRLTGGVGDPNFLAAGVVPAIVLAGGLLGTTRKALLRFVLVAAAAILVIGLIATESRAGLVSAAVATLSGFILFKHRRAHLVAVLALFIGLSAAWFSTHPDSWQRVSDFGGGGTGRAEAWLIGWRIAGDHPLLGIGLNNFTQESSKYVSQPGLLEDVHLIAEKQIFVHNTYLQFLAETGPVGLVLFLGVAFASVRAAIAAGTRFERLGDHSLATLSRSVAVASMAALSSLFFLSGADRRTWLLLALGPALLAVATSRFRASEPHPPPCRRASRMRAIAGRSQIATASEAVPKRLVRDPGAPRPLG